MRFEILREQQYREYEDFVAGHPAGGFTQSWHWQEVKNNWKFAAVVCRGQNDRILGSCGLLIQPLPCLRSAFLYSPRGPVCDPGDGGVLACLKEGIDAVAAQYHAHSIKCDPEFLAGDRVLLANMERLGFRRSWGAEGFEGIQARVNYQLPIAGKTEQQLLAALPQKTRYNIRYAVKHGVTVAPGGAQALDDFMRIYRVTGERDGFSTRPREYFARMLEAFGDNIRLYLGYCNGRAICGAVTLNYGGRCCYVYGASDNACRNLMPNYLLQWEMIRWAVATGCRVYDFQGISGELDNEQNPRYGLYRFKRGFGGEVVELAGEFDFVYRPLVYRMVNHWLARNKKAKERKGHTHGTVRNAAL
ncbi:MAG: peptidoglycan bridge formation glycyltransferase FemA/FemB family protein [Angelakisella sp.]